MRWLIDSDVLIEGEREDPAFLSWLPQEKAEVATADIVSAEFLLGVHAVANTAKRVRAEVFYRDNVQTYAGWFSSAGKAPTRPAGEPLSATPAVPGLAGSTR